jgi:predicted ATPase
LAELPSGTVTLVFTDIESSTRLLRELGDAYGEALTAHRAVLRDAFRARGGVEVDNQGDAFFYAFPAARDAAAAATAAQAALAGGPIRVRMGLHTGEPGRTDEGYFGLDVHLGARVASAGHGGQVVLSQATRDLLDGESVRDLGEHRLQDFDEPVWIFQLGDGVFPPLKTVSNTNLPRPASSFVGREREIDELVERLRESRLVTLTGPGGSGKTRLSIEAASEVVGEFKTGVFWVPLATVHDPALVLPAIARTLGAQGDLAAHLGDREMLLLLDNLEQVVGAAPELATLVEACPNLRLLVTSRELLRVRGEREYEVLPLAEPDGIELFCLRSGLEPSAAIEDLCRRLDIMPLALELAAARTKALTPEQILDRLGERLDLFKGGRDAEERQATLRVTIEWSYDLLTPDEHDLFARLGVFVGGCTLESAEAVAGADLDTIQTLVEKSLVRHTDGRFWMLETIREYAVERLDALPDADAIRRRYAEHFASVAEASGLCVEAIEEGRPPNIELVLSEQANMRAVIDWTVGHDPLLGLSIAADLEQFWVMQNPFEGTARFEALLSAGSDAPEAVRIRALRCLGGASYMANDYARSAQANEEALELCRSLGDEAGEMVMLFRLGTTCMSLGDFDRARALLEESLAGFRRLGKKMGECEASGNLAMMELRFGDAELARRLIEENIELAREVGFTWWEAGNQIALARHSLDTGDLEDAETRAREGLRLEWQLNDRGSTIHCLGLLAATAAARGDRERAGRLWGAVEAEERSGPVGHGWETEDREPYAVAVAAAASPEFDQARTAGEKLSIAEAVDFALAGRNESPPAS